MNIPDGFVPVLAVMLKVDSKKMKQKIAYKINEILPIKNIIKLYDSSGIFRPIIDKERNSNMFKNSNSIVSAWKNEALVGIARALTDFSYCCFLSVLAVDKKYQLKGIGKHLIEKGKI